MGFDNSQFLAGVTDRRRRIEDAVLCAVSEFAQHVIGDVQELAPKDTGALAASGVATEAFQNGNNVVATIGFNTDYAVYVHENLNAHHDNGEAKFLETAITVNGPKFVPFVSAAIAAAMGGAS